MIAGEKFKQTAVINTLRGCQLFSGLPAADLRKIADITVLKKLAKGDYLFREGDPAAGFFVVQSGSLSVHRLNPSGKEQVIHVFRADESFAEATLATDGGYPADSRALEPCQVLLVQKAEFTALIKRQPELGLRMLGSMAMHLRVLIGRLDDLTAKNVETRLAHWLVKRCPQPPSEVSHVIDLSMTKRVLASELGTVSETLSRTLAKFRDQNLIEVHGKTVTIHSPATLDRLARERFDE